MKLILTLIIFTLVFSSFKIDKDNQTIKLSKKESSKLRYFLFDNNKRPSNTLRIDKNRNKNISIIIDSLNVLFDFNDLALNSIHGSYTILEIDSNWMILDHDYTRKISEDRLKEKDEYSYLSGLPSYIIKMHIDKNEIIIIKPQRETNYYLDTFKLRLKE